MTAWPGLPLAAHDTRSPINDALVDALLDATAHDRETLYDDGAGQLPDAPHTHDGEDSHLIVMPDFPNLVYDSQPSTAGRESVDEWSHHGVSVSNAGLEFSRSGDYATIPLGDSGNKLQFAGCDIMMAILVRAREPMTALTVRFGITDGDVSTFASGARAQATVTKIPVGGCRRLYTIFRGFSSLAFSTDARAGLAMSGSFLPAGSKVDITAIVVKPCNVLSQWEPGYYVERQHEWELIGKGEIPLWDDVLNFDRALYVAPS